MARGEPVWLFTLRPTKGRGPVHLCQDPPHDQLGWCGARQQFRHREIEGTVDDVTCQACLAAHRAGHPRAYGHR